MSVVMMIMFLSGCNSQKEVSLSVWCAQEDIPMIETMVESFKEQHKNDAVFTITISAESELTCKQTVLANPEAAADIFVFASDQFSELYNAGALLEIKENVNDVIKENGGADSGAMRSATADGKLYAYPITASNGYFLYYNKNYLSEEDVKSLDRILEVAAENGKKLSMDFSSGWYIYSFFKGAGLDVGLNDDNITNHCNWNATDTKYTGLDVTEAMLSIASHDGFLSCGDEDFVKGAQNGTVIAGINGTWNSTAIEAAFGDGYAAAKLPEYTVKGDSVQMCSFAGYKLMGVNAHTDSPEWSMKLAKWLTNEENQMTRFRIRGEGPSNVNAAATSEVQSSPAIAALQSQSRYGYLQNIGESYWTPTNVFGTVIASKNIDNVDLQFLLDNMQKDIVAPPPAANG